MTNADIKETARSINYSLLKLVSTEEDYIPDAKGDKVDIFRETNYQ